MYPRQRSKDTITQTTVARTVSVTNRSNQISSVKQAKVGLLALMDDWVTPGYKKAQNAGEIINKPMSSQSLTFSSGGNGCKRTNPQAQLVDGAAYADDFGYSLGVIPQLPGFNAMTVATHNFPLCRNEWAAQVIDSAPMITAACTKALGGIRAPDVQGIVLVKELQKTLESLRNPIKAITDYVRKYGNGKRHPSRTAKSKALADQYLGTYYGILPVMSDVEGILKALQRKIAERYTSRASVQQQVVRSALTTNTTNGIDNFTYVDNCEELVIVRAGSLYEIFADSQLRFFGFGISDMPAAALEMVPYSFVVDWLLNVGDLISALTPMADVNRRAEWYTISRTVTWKRMVTNHTLVTSTGWSVLNRPCSDWHTVLYQGYSRSPANLGQHIGLTFRPRMNVGKSLAAISLAVQQLTKGKA